MTALLHLIQSMTTLSSLVEDIYKVLKGGQQIEDSLYEELANDIVNTLRNRLSTTEHRRKNLSLSPIGKPLRRLWYDLKDPEEYVEEPSARLKFLYGDIIEDIILWLAKVSGHTVTDRQREVSHFGIIGHIDSIIDGEVVDAKSASPHSYVKFSKGTLPDNDPFGYLAQLESYDEEVGNGHPGFLAVDKVSGEICLYQPDKDFDLPNTEKLIQDAKDALAKDTPPTTKCYADVADGKSGNMKLSVGCSCCPHKFKCWKNLRAFKYSDGIRYLTTVVNTPKVEEIKND